MTSTTVLDRQEQQLLLLAVPFTTIMHAAGGTCQAPCTSSPHLRPRAGPQCGDLLIKRGAPAHAEQRPARREPQLLRQRRGRLITAGNVEVNPPSGITASSIGQE